MNRKIISSPILGSLMAAVIAALLLLQACGGGGGGGGGSLSGTWTWVAGSNVRGQFGVYGTKGTASTTNVPGAREYLISWVDSIGNLWLFGGQGYDKNNLLSELNDLWKFDGSNWIWVSGADIGSQSGSYGTKNVAASGNMPGARQQAVSWKDSSGSFWLFGGLGFDKNGSRGDLNDLWKFDGTNWTWISGSGAIGQVGNYGTKNVANASNIPGSRQGAAAWTDSNGNFWLFGGYGFDKDGTIGSLNDLWKFDGTNWTWVSGGNTVNQPGTYGTKGTADSGNIPGARASGASWIDGSNNLWMFGGGGYDKNSASGSLNDLWKFDGSNWTWVSGSDTVDQPASYGTVGVADAANVPGARNSVAAWVDASGKFWLLGGRSLVTWYGDFWKFDPATGLWTWVSGSSADNPVSVYGTKGSPSKSNDPGGRSQAVTWVDKNGYLWLFGGDEEIPVEGYYNDLWRYVP